MSNNKSILICYYELAEYFINVVNLLSKHVNIHIIHYPLNKEAPFNYKIAPEITTYSIDTSSEEKIKQLFNQLQPHLIFFAGWSNPIYNSLVPLVKRNQISILGFDNAIDYSLKQLVKAKYFQLFKTKAFDYCFVPGEGQKKLAKKMGFAENQIFKGAYTANVEIFNKIYFKKEGNKPTQKILYLGRYVKHKGIFELWEAFKEIVSENNNLQNWELICAGTGDQWVNRIEHPNIKHLGFLQPNEMEPVLLDTSIYILPSHFEPWGVSVHEMAAAGFPLLLSKEVGSKEAFLEDCKNGYSFPAKNKHALKASLLKMMQLPENELHQMGKHSNKLAQKITPQKWVETIHKILEE